jgi:hypothetical protein
MTAADRRVDGYHPSFDIDLAYGAQGEMFVMNIINSLGNGAGSVEVKTDAKYEKTGRVYVEYECLKRGKWVPSGIQTTTADFWAFVLGLNTFCFFIGTDTLKQAAREKWHNPANRKSCDEGSCPTHGIVLHVDWLTKYAAKCAL